MARKVSKWEHAFRAGRGEPVELAEDDDELDRLTAPVPAAATVGAPAAPTPAAKPSPTPPTGKK
jgi:hypothetical protein